MRNYAIALAMFVAAEGSAIACVCIPPDDREVAARIAANAVAVADVVEVEPMNSQAMQGELYRVLAVHVGKAPENFRLHREFTRSDGLTQVLMTSCDADPPPGERRTVVLYAPEGTDGQAGCGKRSAGSKSATRTLSIGGTCDYLFLQKKGALDLIRQEARRLGKPVSR